MYIVRFQYYQHEHNKPMSCQATAAMISTMLYYRRFFPFYCYNIVGGLDEEGVCILITKALRKHRFQVTRLLFFPGKGAIYSYDPVGSYQREFFKAAGSASALLQPLLDNQVSC